MLRFINNTNYQKVREAIALADEALTPTSKYIKLVTAKNDWKYNPKPMKGINIAVELISSRRTPVFVGTYKSGGNAQATYDGKTVLLDQGYIERASVEEIAATLLHEWAHHCKFMHRSGLFGMTSNFPSKDKNEFNINYWTTINFPKIHRGEIF